MLHCVIVYIPLHISLNKLKCVGECKLQNITTYEGKSISKLQIVIEKKQTGLMTYKQHLFFNVISIQI